MSEVNIPLLRKCVEWVEEQEALDTDQREWRQDLWMSKNGRPVFADGRSSVPFWLNVRRAGRDAAEGAAVETTWSCGTTYCVAGKIAADHDPRYADRPVVDDVHCSDLAADLLGLPPTVDNARPGGLFHGSNDAAAVRRIAEELAGERL